MIGNSNRLKKGWLTSDSKISIVVPCYNEQECLTALARELKLALNPLDYDLYGTFGAEYSFSNMAFARFGSHLGHDTAGVSVGGGINYKNFTIDFAWSNYDILESHTQFGLGYKF